jgi:hypothetical protein
MSDRDKWNVTNDSETVNVVGRFQTQEGVDHLIAALEAQKSLLPDAPVETPKEPTHDRP